MGKLSGLVAGKVEKAQPIKAGSTYQDNVGGIFQRKVIAIWQKIFGNKNG